jgi:intein-encoded DNA endonuclease-like protein
MEVNATIDNLSWSEGLEDVIKNIGLNDRSLKALRKFGESRSSSLQKACQLYLKSMTVLNILNDNADWGIDEQKEWANALQLKKDARKMWSKTLHQIDSLSKSDKNALEFISEELTKSGSLGSRELVRRGVGMLHKSITPSKVSMLIKMYGEEVDIYKASSRGNYVKLDTHGLIIKNIWAYAAGFLDADGSIFITERGEPRATFIATGNRGKLQCEELHKALGCGRLVLNQRIHKKSVRSQHRLIFSSKNDLRQLLKGILPHLKMKSLQAKAVLSFVDEKDKMRKNELYQLVTYNNWKDDKKKADSFLSKWNLDADTIGSYAESL